MFTKRHMVVTSLIVIVVVCFLLRLRNQVRSPSCPHKAPTPCYPRTSRYQKMIIKVLTATDERLNHSWKHSSGISLCLTPIHTHSCCLTLALSCTRSLAVSLPLPRPHCQLTRSAARVSEWTAGGC